MVSTDDDFNPVYKHIFVTAEKIKGKKVRSLVETYNIPLENFANLKNLGDDVESLQKDFKKHLKFTHDGIDVSEKPPKHMIPSFPNIGLCMFAKIKVVLDRFSSEFEHYVNTLEDNWISKEFMQVVYDPKLIENREYSHENKNNELKNKAQNKFSNVPGKDKDESDLIQMMKDEISSLVDYDDGSLKDKWHAIRNNLSTDEESAKEFYQ